MQLEKVLRKGSAPYVCEGNGTKYLDLSKRFTKIFEGSNCLFSFEVCSHINHFHKNAIVLHR